MAFRWRGYTQSGVLGKLIQQQCEEDGFHGKESRGMKQYQEKEEGFTKDSDKNVKSQGHM